MGAFRHIADTNTGQMDQASAGVIGLQACCFFIVFFFLQIFRSLNQIIRCIQLLPLAVFAFLFFWAHI